MRVSDFASHSAKQVAESSEVQLCVSRQKLQPIEADSCWLFSLKPAAGAILTQDASVLCFRVEDSDWGGRSTKSELHLTPTADDDQQIYACSASNPLLERAVHDAITLDVLCESRPPAHA